MKRFLGLSSLIIIVISIFLMGCSNSNQTVIKNHFKYVKEKNLGKILTTLTERNSNAYWDFDNLESIKLINIEEEKNEKFKQSYLLYGEGKTNGTTEKNLKVYKVNYEIKYKNDTLQPQTSGIYDWWYLVIRKDENSPWLIDEVTDEKAPWLIDNINN